MSSKRSTHPSNQGLKPAFRAVALATLLATSAVAAGTEESSDRVVDQASVDMQDEADRDLSAMVAKYRSTPREAEMLLRLAELRLEIADSLFRVAYGPNEKGLKAAYSKKLVSGIAPLNRILEAYPKSDAAGRALFLRGRANKELGQNAEALKDFERFLSSYPSREEAPLAAVGVADLSIEKQRYERAISVLRAVLSKPGHPLYPNALAKRAWALQAAGHPAEAVADLRLLSRFFRDRAAANRLSSGDAALRESILGDVPSIAYLAFRANPRAFSLQSLNTLLRSFDTGDGYRRMAVKVTDALRASDLNTDLRTWKALVLKSDPSQSENVPMLVSVLEYDLDREAFTEVAKTAEELVKILPSAPAEESEAARKLIVRAIDKLTKRISDYRASEKANDAEKILATLLPTFDRMTTASDSRRLATRWNLAETYFSLERYASAATTYRWIYENWDNDAGAALAKTTTRPGAFLKAISSRYEALRAMKIIPEDLEATARTAKASRDSGKLGLVREWMAWIETYQSRTGARLDSYSFEAARAIYQAGNIDEALALMKSLVIADPNSKIAVPAASLVIDTWIARKNWKQVEEESKAFASAFSANRPFASKMATQAAAAKFKLAENVYATKNFAMAVEHAEAFVQAYPRTNLAIDAAGMICNARLAAREMDQAVDCFSRFSKTYEGTKAAIEALRSAARIEDERLHFATAADLYSRYLASMKKGGSVALSASENLAIRRRILLLSRATGDGERMIRISKNRAVCSPKLETICELNLALAALQKGSDSIRATEDALRKALLSKAELRSIYALIAIEGLATDQWRSLDPSSIERATRLLAQNWKSTDPSIRYFLIARATKAFPKILERGREAAKSLSIDATEKTITRRMRALKSFEARVASVSEVPVNSIRAVASQALYASYADLIGDMRAIPAPVNATPAQISEHRQLLAMLSNPFVMKSRKLRDAALSLELREKAGLDMGSIDAVWSRSGTMSAAGEALRTEWAKAVSDENWSRVAFLSAEASEVKGVPSGWSKAARAASLAGAGALSEARAVFGDACRDGSNSPSVRDACRNTLKKGRS